MTVEIMVDDDDDDDDVVVAVSNEEIEGGQVIKLEIKNAIKDIWNIINIIKQLVHYYSRDDQS